MKINKLKLIIKYFNFIIIKNMENTYKDLNDFLDNQLKKLAIEKKEAKLCGFEDGLILI